MLQINYVIEDCELIDIFVLLKLAIDSQAKMSKPKGFKSYKTYWEDQAEFMDKFPWDGEKIAKLTILHEFENELKDLQYSNHSLTKEYGHLILRLKLPYNYQELDDFKSKAIELLGIDRNWLVDFTFDDSHCSHS